MREDTSGTTIARDEEALVGAAYWKPGDVVTTHERVRCVNPRGRFEGTALPGWKWRVVAVRVQWTRAGAKYVVYDCVSHDEPRMYRATLRAKQIVHQTRDKIKSHQGELLGRKST